MDIRMPSGWHPHMTEEAMSAVKRAIISGVILLVLSGWARPAQAASFRSSTSGLSASSSVRSRCAAPRSSSASCTARSDSTPTRSGRSRVAITHDGFADELQETGSTVTVGPGGAFDFRFGLRRIRGEVVLPDGVALRRCNGNNTFIVLALLFDGAEGDLIKADVLLDHACFRPR